MKRTYANQPEMRGPEGAPKIETSTKTKKKEEKKEGHRETVEAVVFAFVLALLVRGFEAEAFVIPTGSMAPTLMGRHKEIACPECGYVYAVNASIEDDGGRSLGLAGFRLGASKPGNYQSQTVVAGTCVNCRFQAKLSDEPTFNGDRILVMKFPYDMPFLPGAGGPDRWDIVVFRYPEDPEVSYIKRLVGLPGEDLRIWFGDLYIKPPGAKDYQIERKPLEHQAAMGMLVYDDRHRAAKLQDKPEWLRWTSSGKTAWNQDVKGSPGLYKVEAAEGQESELRYRHLVPDPEQWDALAAGEAPARGPRPTVITDFYSYNTSQTSLSRSDYDGGRMQPHWVGDLSLSTSFEAAKLQGVVRFELVEGGVINRCEIDLKTGVANLYHGDERLNKEPSAPVITSASTKYDVTFANVDNRLTLLINNRPVFGDGLTYDDPKAHPIPTVEDLSPARVAAVGASVSVSDLVLKRDIYYTLNPGYSDYDGLWDNRYSRTAVEVFDNLADPAKLAFLSGLQPRDFAIGQDRYVMMGDNSPQSKDSRGWSTADHRDPNIPIEESGAGWDSSNRASWEVPRAMLTGKAFFIYWPHGKPFGPDIRINHNFRVPFLPYFERMKWIR